MVSRTKSKEINMILFESDKLAHAIAMLPEAIGASPDKDAIDKIVEDFIFDFDTCFRCQERVMAEAGYRLLVSHGNDHGRIMDLLSSLRYANMVEIMSWEEIRRIIADACHRHTAHFDDVFTDYIKLKQLLSRPGS
jgi:hemerythrin